MRRIGPINYFLNARTNRRKKFFSSQGPVRHPVADQKIVDLSEGNINTQFHQRNSKSNSRNLRDHGNLPGQRVIRCCLSILSLKVDRYFSRFDRRATKPRPIVRNEAKDKSHAGQSAWGVEKEDRASGSRKKPNEPTEAFGQTCIGACRQSPSDKTGFAVSRAFCQSFARGSNRRRGSIGGRFGGVYRVAPAFARGHRHGLRAGPTSRSTTRQRLGPAPFASDRDASARSHRGPAR